MLAVLAVFSCQKTVETEASLSANFTEITVPADAVDTTDPQGEFPSVVKDSVKISSTRSWSAIVKADDSGDWISLETAEHINVSGQQDETYLVIVLDRYKGSAPRNAKLKIYAAGVAEPLVIGVSQRAFQPVLKVCASDEGVIPSLGAECGMEIRSNTRWSVSVDTDKSDIIPEFSLSEGENSSVISIYFQNNMDDSARKKAFIVVKAEGCEDQTLELLQEKSEKFFYLQDEVPAEVAPYLSQIHIPLKSNGPWTAEISDCDFDDATLVPAYGSYSLEGFDFIAAHGADPEKGMKKATITIHRDGMENLVVQFTQSGSIYLHTCQLNPDYEWLKPEINPYSPYESAGYPFSEPKSLPNSFTSRTYAGQALDCITKQGGYVFTMYGQDCGVWSTSSNTALCIGKMKDDYVLLPGIDGYRLSRMYYQASCRVATPYTVRTEDGSSIIAGGEYQVTQKVIPVDTEFHDMHCHVFPDTKAGVRYRINLEKDYEQISIKDLCLVYEPAE